MPADTLLDMARRVAARNVHKITDIGNMPYQLVRPILQKVESPEKLHQLELNSPQLIGHTGELWLGFMKRDIPDYHLKAHVPKNPKSWYKAYKKLKNEASKASSDAEAILKATLSGIQDKKDQNTAEVASSAVGAALWSKTDAPGATRRARVVYGYMSGKTGSKGANKMTVMEKIRREAKSAKSGVMGRPMHELQKKYNGVTTAPAAFVEDVKRMKVLQQVEAKKTIIPPPRRATGTASTSRPSNAPWNLPPKHRPQPATASGIEPYDLTNDREARLQALKSGKPLPPMQPCPTYDPRTQSVGNENGSLTLDFLETDSDDEAVNQAKKPVKKRQRDDDDDDIFDEKRPVQKRQKESDDELFGESKPVKRRQRDADDELFGTTAKPSKKRDRSEDEDDDISPPPKMSKPSTTRPSKNRHVIKDDDEDDNVSPPPAPKILNPQSKPSPTPAHNAKDISPHLNLLKPLPGNDLLQPLSRSGSPMKLSPANSPRLQPTKTRRREAPSLFMKKR